MFRHSKDISHLKIIQQITHLVNLLFKLLLIDICKGTYFPKPEENG